jgi:hypothetical protein
VRSIPAKGLPTSIQSIKRPRRCPEVPITVPPWTVSVIVCPNRFPMIGFQGAKLNLIPSSSTVKRPRASNVLHR